MKIGFDLDGTLDKPALCDLCIQMIAEGHEVHIITGIFDEAGEWQSERAKRTKLMLLGIPFCEYERATAREVRDGVAYVHFLHAMPETYSVEYRRGDLGMRKGELTQRLGIRLYFDNSADYMKTIRSMDGNVTLLQVQ